MKTWICEQCQWEGEDPHTIMSEGWFDNTTYSEQYVCPECGNEDVVDLSFWDEEPVKEGEGTTPPRISREEAISLAIEDVMDSFDCHKCVKVMNALDWNWWWNKDDEMTEYWFRKGLRKALEKTSKYGSYRSAGFNFKLVEGKDEEGTYLYFDGGFEVESLLAEPITYYSKRKDNRTLMYSN